MNFILLFYVILAVVTPIGNTEINAPLAAWQPGYLDIHHINTASGDAAFFIFPDGTTMLFDAGDVKAPENNPEFFFLETNKKYTAGQIIAKYIQAVHPDGEKTEIDYAVISHFHGDHYGKLTPQSATSSNGAYLLSGITEVDEIIPIKTLIDRSYPDYDTPKGLSDYYANDQSFLNYLKYVDYREKSGRMTQRLQAGRRDQIKLKTDAYPEFHVRNLKSNLFTWTGEGDNALERQHDYTPDLQNCGFNENPLSLALQVNYGDFDYFTGGDMTGFDFRNLLDMETPIAKATGEMDVVTLNHHGYWDATNRYFMETLHPSVVVLPSRHDPHFQFDPLSKVADLKAHLYTNNLHESVSKLFSDEFKNLTKGANGHILIRVLPKGEEFYVYMLNDDDFDLNVLSKNGPYESEK